jgi:hypothetical protein
MRSQRAAPLQGNVSKRTGLSKAGSGTTHLRQQPDERDAFLKIQAESGRRMRPIVAEHYGEAE